MINNIQVGVDIGNESIKVVVGKPDNLGISILASVSANTKGMLNGEVQNVEDVALTLKNVLLKAQEAANVIFNEISVGVPTEKLKMVPIKGSVQVASDDKKITTDDIQNVAKNALSELSDNDEIVAEFPTDFSLDGFDGIKDPLGMVGVHLEMNGMAYIGDANSIEKLKNVVQTAGFKISQMVLNPIALAKSMLNENEQNEGTVILDIGAGQTTASIIQDGQLKFTSSVNEGGFLITNDIVQVLNTTFPEAERLKREFGVADTFKTDGTKQITYIGSDRLNHLVSETYLSEIIAARLEQIFSKLIEKLNTVGAKSISKGGIVVTGGVSAMPTIADVASNMFASRVRLWAPENAGVRHPSYARAFSLTSFIANQSETEFAVGRVASISNLLGNNKIDSTKDSDGYNTVMNANSNGNTSVRKFNNSFSKIFGNFVNQVVNISKKNKVKK